MTYPYGLHGAPAVGGGLGGLPRREVAYVDKSITEDPYFNNVSLLLHCDQFPFVDSSRFGTSVGTAGTSVLSSTVSKFGAGGLDVSAVGSYLTVPASSQMSFDGDFTIEGWFLNSNWSNVVALFGGAFDQAGRFRVDNANGGAPLQCEVYGFGVVANCPAPSNMVWSHIALVRKSGVFKLFLNGAAGTFSGQDTSAVTMNNNETFYVGNNYVANSSFKGYIDEFRVTKGVARYTANFLPSNYPFPNK